MALYESVSIRNMVEVGGKLYANNMVTNDIIVMDKNSFEIIDVIDIHMENIERTATHTYFQFIVASDKALFLFPFFYSGYSVRYDLQTKEITYKKMQEWCDVERFVMPYQHCEVDGKVYFAPDKIEEPFLVLDLDREYMDKVSFIPDYICEKYCSNTKVYAHNMCIIGSEMLLSGEQEMVLFVDVKTKEVKEYNIPKKSKNLLNIIEATESAIWYISEGEKQLCCLNRENGSIKSYEIDENVKEWGIVPTEDTVLLYANGSFEPGKMYLLDLKTEQLRELQSTPSWHRHQDFRDSGFWNYHGYVKRGEEIILIPEASDMLLKVNTMDYSVTGIEMRFDERFSGYTESYILKKFFECAPCLEEKGFGLEEMLNGMETGLLIKNRG